MRLEYIMNQLFRTWISLWTILLFEGIIGISSICGSTINESDDGLAQRDVYRWKEYNDGLTSWSIVGIAIDFQNPSTVYALTRSHGLYKTVNSGASWVEENEGLSEPHIVHSGHLRGNLLTMDPNNPEILFANFNGEVYKYTDVEGKPQWININNGIDVCTSPGVAGILVDPQNSDHIFAAHIVSGCSGGIFESWDAHLNEDLTWEQIASWTGSGAMENDAWTLTIDPTDSSKLFCAPPYLGFLYSKDGGHYWYRNTPLGEGRKGANIIVVHPDITNRVILGHPKGIHHGTYTIQGEDFIWTWTDLTGSVSGYIWDIDFALSDHNIAYAVSSHGLFRSDDGGLSWTEIGSYEDLFLKSVAIDPANPDIIYLGTGNGMYRSIDSGVHVTDITNEILPEMEVRATAIAPADPNTFYCNIFGVGFYKSVDQGRSWIQTSGESGVTKTITIHVDKDNPDVVYAGLEFLYKSVDGGLEWSVSLDTERNEQFFDIDMDSQGNLYATSIYTVASDERYAEFYKSTDSGLTWESPNESFHHRSICTGPIVVDPNDIVYVASYDFLRRSTDGGENWTKLTSGLTGDPCDRWIDGLAVDPVEPNRLYLCARSHNLFTSTDQGDSWSELSMPVPLYPGRIIFDHRDHSVFYVFGLYGWCKYTDYGTVHEEMSTEGIDAPYMNFRGSALQDPLDANRFITGDFFQGFLIFDNHNLLPHPRNHATLHFKDNCH
jgi:photosystem II stability/assembly factor-like uncharacterized protein